MWDLSACSFTFSSTDPQTLICAHSWPPPVAICPSCTVRRFDHRMEYPPGLLAASTPSLTRQAVFNPYDIPVSPHIRDLVVPKLTGNLNYCGSIGWFVCLPGWWNHSAAILFPLKKYHPTTTLNTFPLGISTLRCVEPYMSSTSCSGRLHEESPFLNLSDHRQAILCFPWVYYRANPNGFIRTLGAPEENLDLGVTADAGLLSRRQPHRNFDSLTQPDSHSTGYTTTQHHHPTPPPNTTPTPARSRSRTPPPMAHVLPFLSGSSTSTPWTTSYDFYLESDTPASS